MRSWLLVCLLPSAALAAGDWKVTSGVSLSERYTDNVSLTAGGGASSFVTQVSPRIGLSRSGKRGNVNLAYSLNGLLYDHDVGSTSLNHDLNASMQVEPVTGIMKLAGNARVGQQYASQLGPTSQDTYHTTANRVETRALSLTPSLHNEFFQRNLITDASLALNHASSDSNVLSTSTSNTLNLAARSGSRPGRLTYAVNYRRSSGESGGAASSVLTSQSYNVGYVPFRKTRFFIAGGRDNSAGIASLQGRGSSYLSQGFTWSPTTYFSLTGTVGTSGGSASYSLSGNWAPSRRINLAATLGRRNDGSSYGLSGSWAPSALTSLSGSVQKNFSSAAFGVEGSSNGLSSYGATSYALNLSHRLRRSALSLRYSESVVEASQQLNQIFTSLFYVCPNGAGGFTTEATQNAAGTCIAPGTSIQNAQLLNQSTLNKTWAGTYNYSLGRSALAFSLSQSQREYLGTAAGGSDQQTNFSANWSLPMNTRTSTTLGATWSTAESAAQASDSWALNWSLLHTISQHVTSGLTARHSEQTTTGGTGSTKENTLSAQLGMTF